MALRLGYPQVLPGLKPLHVADAQLPGTCRGFLPPLPKRLAVPFCPFTTSCPFPATSAHDRNASVSASASRGMEWRKAAQEGNSAMKLSTLSCTAGGPAPVRAVSSSASAAVESPAGFESMLADTDRKYYMVGGKGGVGKTSVSASLGVRFADAGVPTLVVSTDPAHSLSDSFAQDVSGGMPVLLDGCEGNLFAMEIDPEQAREEFRAAATAGSNTDGTSGVKDLMDSVGLGAWVEQLSELKLGELLDTPPPGLDEAVAIAKVVQFIQAEEYSKFKRIVFDTAPTGHTLRLLSLPDFLDASIGKILKLKAKISSATNAVKSIFGQNEGKDLAAEKLEKLKERMGLVRDIFRDQKTTEFVIVTIPTVMALSESSRLLKSLEAEGVPVRRLVVNQLLPHSHSDCKFCNIKHKDQQRALALIRSDPELSHLNIVEAPLFDLEIRGIPALRFMGDVVWR